MSNFFLITSHYNKLKCHANLNILLSINIFYSNYKLLYTHISLIIHLGGWHASTENTNKVERYNFELDYWETKHSMLEKRYRPGVAVINGKIYICGGEEGWDRYKNLH